MSFNYAMEMDELKGHMDFVQGMDELIQIKINDDGSEKEQNKGAHWMQKIDMKMQDKNEDMPWKMIWQRMISTQFDKKIPELYVATEYEEKNAIQRHEGTNEILAQSQVRRRRHVDRTTVSME